MIFIVPFLVWSFMAVMDEKENNVKITCYDEKYNVVYEGIRHVTVVPKIGDELDTVCTFSKEKK